MLAVHETPTAYPKPRLLDRVRDAIRARHYSRRTEDAYVGWIRRYIFFHGKRHPAEMGAPEVARFLSSLAVDGHVAASTQNQALSALLFLYPQPAALEYAKTRAVEQARHEPRRPIEPPERRAHLVTREDDWQPLGPPGAHDLVQPRQLHAQQRDRHGPHRQRRAAACRDPLV
ncbi:MAG: hypothetical protein DMD80_19825 [Candidatus Rokuibacteriota bacterium]|nr:MAG: hypothetical protein DMD80_19825 [Candidatus Rokubacteria bacterium]